MLFRELWSLRAPVRTSCLRYWGDLLWITLCTKIDLLHWRRSFKGHAPCEMCPRPVSTGEAAQRERERNRESARACVHSCACLCVYN